MKYLLMLALILCVCGCRDILGPNQGTVDFYVYPVDGADSLRYRNAVVYIDNGYPTSINQFYVHHQITIDEGTHIVRLVAKGCYESDCTVYVDYKYDSSVELPLREYY